MQQSQPALVSRRLFCRQMVILIAGWPLPVTALADINAGFGPQQGQSGLDDQNQMQISRADRCPVCGMKVSRYPKFSSAIQLEDRRTYYFCSNGCMLRTWLHPEIYLKAPKPALLLAIVRDYFTGRQVDAKIVFWIAGSNIIGPMGPAFVAVQGDRSVKAFTTRHGGRRVFRLQELTDDLWFAVTGKHAGNY